MKILLCAVAVFHVTAAVAAYPPECSSYLAALKQLLDKCPATKAPQCVAGSRYFCPDDCDPTDFIAAVPSASTITDFRHGRCFATVTGCTADSGDPPARCVTGVRFELHISWTDGIQYPTFNAPFDNYIFPFQSYPAPP